MRARPCSPIGRGARWLGLMPILDPARVRFWAGRAFWAFADQGLFAGANFVVGVLLARWLEPIAYGAFSTAYAVFLLVGTLHSALWTEPMVVYGSGRFSDAFDKYCGVLLRYHWRFGAGIALAFLVAGATFRVLGEEGLGRSLGAFCFAAPCILYLWLVRRSAYVILEPRLAALGGGLYLALFVGAALALWRTGVLAEWNAIFSMGASALAAGALVGRTVQKRAGIGLPADAEEVRALHWRYGRWAAVAGVLSWVPGNFYSIALPALHGLESAALYKALAVLLMPVVHFNTSSAQLFLPLLARAVQSRSRRRAVAIFFCQTSLQLAVALVVGITVVWLNQDITTWLYKEKFAAELPVYYLLAVNLAALALMTALTTFLRALELPRIVFQGSVVSAVATCGVGLYLAYGFGVDGAFVSSLVANVGAISWLALSLAREVKAFRWQVN